MPDRDTFEAALDELLARGAPERVADMRLVYADWLDEHGDLAAGAQRWMAREGKSPRGSGVSWDWWSYGDRPDGNPEDLPLDIWRRLPGDALAGARHCKEFPSRRSAERALFKALMLLNRLAN